MAEQVVVSTDPTPADPPSAPAASEGAPDVSTPIEGLPANFKTVQDLADSYSSLQSEFTKMKQGSVDTGDAGDAGDAGDSSSSETLADFEALGKEYMEYGGLSDESIEALAEKGIPPEIMDVYFKGIEASVAEVQNSVYDTVGGQETYEAMTEWAADAMSDSEADAFNAAIQQGGDIAKLAVEGLHNRYVAAVGNDGTQLAPKGGNEAGGRYESIQQMTADMQDPRYKTDPAFRAEVEGKLARSNIM